MASISSGWLVGLALLVGCTGATTMDFFDGETQSEQHATTAPGGSGPGATPGTSSSGTDPNGPTGNGGPIIEPPAPTPPARDAGPDVQPEPPPVCTPEIEPNDRLAQATPFTSSLCGTLDSEQDDDYGQVVAPPNATSVTIDHSDAGHVRYEPSVLVAGHLTPLQEGTPVPLVGGATLVIRVRPGGNFGKTRPTYQVNFVFR